MTSVQSRRLSVERGIDGRGMEEGEEWVKKGEEEREGRKSSLFEKKHTSMGVMCCGDDELFELKIVTFQIVICLSGHASYVR